MELEKKYNPQNVESKWYECWMEQNMFEPNESLNEPFTIMIPPPNVTGILHMGHVLNNTIQDCIKLKINYCKIYIKYYIANELLAIIKHNGFTKWYIHREKLCLYMKV